MSRQTDLPENSLCTFFLIHKNAEELVFLFFDGLLIACIEYEKHFSEFGVSPSTEACVVCFYVQTLRFCNIKTSLRAHSRDLVVYEHHQSSLDLICFGL